MFLECRSVSMKRLVQSNPLTNFLSRYRLSIRNNLSFLAQLCRRYWIMSEIDSLWLDLLINFFPCDIFRDVCFRLLSPRIINSISLCHHCWLRTNVQFYHCPVTQILARLFVNCVSFYLLFLTNPILIVFCYKKILECNISTIFLIDHCFFCCFYQSYAIFS